MLQVNVGISMVYKNVFILRFGIKLRAFKINFELALNLLPECKRKM